MTRETEETRPAFGALLRGHRRAHQLTQEALAERAGLSAPGVSLLERGRVEPRFGTVARLADALGLTLERARARWSRGGGRRRTGSAAAPPCEAPAPRGGLSRKASSFVGRERRWRRCAAAWTSTGW